MSIDPGSLTEWIKIYLAVLIGEPSESIDTTSPLSYFDLDSLDAVNLALELEDRFGFAVHPETFMDYNASINDISLRLSEAA